MMLTLHSASVLEYFHEFNLDWLGVVLVGYNLSLSAWIRFPIEVRNFNLFGASFGICSWETYAQDDGGRLNLPLD